MMPGLFTISSDRLSGVYHTGAYRKYIQAMADKEVDKVVVRSFEGGASVVRDGCDDVFDYAARDAADFVSRAYSGEMVLDTTNMFSWLSLYSAITSSAALALFGARESEVGMSNADLILHVACVCDVMTRAADDGVKAEMVNLAEYDGNTILRRGFGIYRDIVCGRAMMWLSCISDMVRQLCDDSGVNFDLAMDAYRHACLETAVAITGGDVASYMEQLTEVARSFDSFQATVHDYSFAGDAHVPNDEESRSAVDVERARELLESFGSEEIPEDLYGYCGIAGVRPMDCVAMVPREVLV